MKSDIRQQTAICITTDWITTAAAFCIFNIFRYYYMGLQPFYQTLGGYLLSQKLILEEIIVPFLLLGVYWLSGYYNNPMERSRLSEFLVTLYSQIFNALIIYLGALTNDQLMLRRENWILLLILLLILFTFTYIGRLIVTDRLIKRIREHKFSYRVVIVGMSKEAQNLALRLKNSTSFPTYTILGFLPLKKERTQDDLIPDMSDVKIFNNLEDLKNLCAAKELDQIIIVPNEIKAPTKKIMYLLYHLFPFDVSIRINPDTLSFITSSIRLQDIKGEPFIDLSTPAVSEFSKNVKRTLDVFISGLGLIILSPVYALISILIKTSGDGPVFYSQERIGSHRKPFNIYKFRSMIVEAEKSEPLLSSDFDPRITKVGRWMRKYRLDELPQLWNVFKGDMSLVGPRPERAFFIEKIVKKAPWYTLVLQVKPGITSWGMVKYGYATSVDEMIERNRFDLVYLSNMSVAVDFKILLHTINTVASGKGK